MKKSILLFFAILCSVYCFAQDHIWLFKSEDGKTFNLQFTTWKSSADGSKLYFDREENGHFEGGRAFSYAPTFHHDKDKVIFSRQSEVCNLYYGELRKPFNTFRLTWVKDQPVIVDKDGKTYVQVVNAGIE